MTNSDGCCHEVSFSLFCLFFCDFCFLCIVFALLLGCAGSANLQWWLSPGRLYNRVEVTQGEEGGAGSCKDVKCKVMMLVMRRWIFTLVMKFKLRRDKVGVIVQETVACSLKSSVLVFLTVANQHQANVFLLLPIKAKGLLFLHLNTSTGLH